MPIFLIIKRKFSLLSCLHDFINMFMFILWVQTFYWPTWRQKEEKEKNEKPSQSHVYKTSAWTVIRINLVTINIKTGIKLWYLIFTNRLICLDKFGCKKFLFKSTITVLLKHLVKKKKTYITIVLICPYIVLAFHLATMNPITINVAVQANALYG